MFVSTLAAALGETYYPEGLHVTAMMEQLFDSLSHFRGKYRAKHVFLASRDRHDLNSRLLREVERSGAGLVGSRGQWQ